MDKRENVINGLECCSVMGDREPLWNSLKARNCGKCPYNKPGIACTRALAYAALELLKSDEPVKPIHLHNTKIHSSLKDVVFEDECGNCNGYLLRTWKACPICGRKVMWDG